MNWIDFGLGFMLGMITLPAYINFELYRLAKQAKESK